MTKQKAMSALARAAARFGGHIEDDSCGDIRLQVCAPEGAVWLESGGQHLVVATRSGNAAWLAAAVADGLERIERGIRSETPGVSDSSRSVTPLAYK